MASRKPILAVDVDGVVVLLGEGDPALAAQTRVELIDGMMRRVSLAAGVALRRLGGEYELVWATGWGRRANRHFPRLLGIPELPCLDFGPEARFGSADWKLRALGERAAGRPLAWVDDNHDEACREWAQRRSEPTLLVSVEPSRGLGAEQAETLLRWAGSLGQG